MLRLACSAEVPAWHAVGMALRGGQIDVRMAHALRARRRRRGTRCGGALALPFDGHHPVFTADVRLVAMFRRPAQRILSAFLDDRHAWGLVKSQRATMRREATSAARFARFPGIAGCMAKMLAGHQCASRVELADGAVVSRAISLLQSERFAFVGLVDEWATSVRILD